MRSKWLWAALALVAVLGITTAASATTRGLITGKQIAPHTINSKHLVNHTIQKHDLSARLIKSLHGARGPIGPMGPKGDSVGIAGLEVVIQWDNVSGGGENTTQAFCPAGKVVLGGGVKGIGPISIRSSYPSPDGRSWTAVVGAPLIDGAGPSSYDVYAICALPA